MRAYDADQKLGKLAQTLAETLDKRRRVLGLSKAALARESEVARAQVIRWLRGDTVPKPQNLSRLAGLLDIDESELMRLAGYLSDPHTDPRNPLNEDQALSGVIALLRRRWSELEESEQRAIAAVVRTLAGGPLEERKNAFHLLLVLMGQPVWQRDSPDSGIDRPSHGGALSLAAGLGGVKGSLAVGALGGNG